MTMKKMRELQPPPPSDSFTIEEAMAAWAKVEADEKARRALRRKPVRAASVGTDPAAKEAAAAPKRIRTLQPPHPGASITLEQAMQALDEVRAEEKAQRALRRKRARAAAAKPRKARGKVAGGG